MSIPSPKQDQETVVLLHSSASSARQWDALAGALADRYRVHAIDLHGHGHGPAWRGPGPLRLEHDALLAARILAEAGSAHVVGHSYGGAVALKLASLQPTAVRSVVAFEPTLFRILIDEDDWALPARDIRFAADVIRAFVHAGSSAEAARHFVDFWSGRGQYDRMPAARQRSVAERMTTVLAHFEALFAEPLTCATLRQVAMPRLFLTGAETVATTRYLGEVLRRRVPAAVHETLPGMAHMGPILQAEAVNARIEAFLDSVSSPAAAPAAGAAAGPTIAWGPGRREASAVCDGLR
jgi:pimeloyl-ACP methyl ester carboxylesterase